MSKGCKVRPNCRKCGIVLTSENRQIRKSSDRGFCNTNYCVVCYAKKIKSMRAQYQISRWKLKREAIIQKGGKCQLCGYDDLSCVAVFDFHHVDGKKKERVANLMGKKMLTDKRSLTPWKNLWDELNKCVCLCAICHRKIHSKEGK